MHQIPSLVAISKPRDREKDGSVRGQCWLDIGKRREVGGWESNRGIGFMVSTTRARPGLCPA